MTILPRPAQESHIILRFMFLMPCILLTGLKIVSVYADCRKRKLSQCEDIVHVLFEMEGGVTGTADFSKVSGARSGRYEFVFDENQLHGDQIHGRVVEIAGTKEIPLEQFGPEPTIVSLLQEWKMLH